MCRLNLVIFVVIHAVVVPAPVPDGDDLGELFES